MNTSSARPASFRQGPPGLLPVAAVVVAALAVGCASGSVEPPTAPNPLGLSYPQSEDRMSLQPLSNAARQAPLGGYAWLGGYIWLDDTLSNDGLAPVDHTIHSASTAPQQPPGR